MCIKKLIIYVYSNVECTKKGETIRRRAGDGVGVSKIIAGKCCLLLEVDS